MKTEFISTPSGMTVKQLKEILKDWPESAEVWIETGYHLSSVVVEAWPLDKREDMADLLLSSSAFQSAKEQNEVFDL